MKFILKPGQLTLNDIRKLMDESLTITLDPSSHEAIDASQKLVEKVISQGKTVYGINTGFGSLANTQISPHDLHILQKNLVLSHAAGTGELLSDKAVRLILLLKINSLARGFSGIRLKTIEALITLFNEKIYPCIPSQGSVGASGDLAPLAHMSAVLLGVGEVRYQGRVLDAARGLRIAGLRPLKLAAKEGLALLNGTQVSTALALAGLFAIENVFAAALISGAMSVDALKGSDAPFDRRIHAVRRQPGQMAVAAELSALLRGSRVRASH